MRPPHGLQRGSVADMQLYPGDPLTPGVGATKDAKRLKISDAPSIMKIPVVPIGYADALYFDQIIVITGRADVIMDFQGSGPFPTDQEALYTELVVGRLTNTGGKPATKTTTPPPNKINWIQVRPAGPAPGHHRRPARR